MMTIMLPKLFKEPSVCQALFKILYTDYLHQLLYQCYKAEKSSNPHFTND